VITRRALRSSACQRVAVMRAYLRRGDGRRLERSRAWRRKLSRTVDACPGVLHANGKLSSPCLTSRCSGRAPRLPLEGGQRRDAAGCARGSSRPWYARASVRRPPLNGKSFDGPDA
jgi:hypothetical protein